MGYLHERFKRCESRKHPAESARRVTGESRHDRQPPGRSIISATSGTRTDAVMTKVAFVKYGNVVDEYRAARDGRQGIYEGQSWSYVEQFLRALEGKPVEYLLVSTGPVDDGMRDEAGDVVSIGSGPATNGISYLLSAARTQLRLIRLLHRHDPDVVLQILPRPLFWMSWLYCAVTRRRLIASFHGAVFVGESLSRVIDRWWLRRLLKRRFVIDVWAIGPDLAEQIERLKPRLSVTTIYPRYDDSFFSPAAPRQDEDEERGFIVTFVGRVVAAKGIFDLVRIVELLAGRIPELRCHVVGDGADLPAMKRLVSEKRLDRRFTFAGYQSRVGDWLARSDVLVIPTSSTFNEGLNKVAVEGLLCEVPLVVSDVCGLRGTASQGVGYAVEPGDIRTFAEKIEIIYRDPGIREHFRAAARRLRPFYQSPPATLESELARHLEICLDPQGPRSGSST